MWKPSPQPHRSPCTSCCATFTRADMATLPVRKFNQAHKLMKKANVDQFNFTLKLAETIDSAQSAAENAQQEIVKLDLAGEKLN